jgi:hypothetical protein
MVAGVEGIQPFCTGEVPTCTSKGEVLPPILPCLPTSLEPQRASRPKARSLWSRSPPTTSSLSPLPALTRRMSLHRRSTGCSTAALTRRSLSSRLPTSSAQTAVTAARRSLRRRSVAVKNLRRRTSAALAAITLTRPALTMTATAPTRTMTMVLSLFTHTHRTSRITMTRRT